MIIYDNTKNGFMKDVSDGVLIDKIYTNFKEKIGRTGKSEILSWDNSLQKMYMVMNDDNIPDNSGIAIEYKIPTSSKRIDFIISGRNDVSKSVVIVELKQWDAVSKVDYKDGIVETFLGGGIRETTHPSYQVASYASLINDFNEVVSTKQVTLHPCAYLHNYVINRDYDPLTDTLYQEYLDQAPVFGRADTELLRNFIKRNIKYGDNKETLYLIENGKIRPSKSLQESLVKMLEGNEEFTMIDE
ncbi:hypothetical protein [Moraxella canis]|uniref:hypothetical protein n=1 Tax=Moraxella canis TaxID=90239 RepID=UPI001F463A16|nr:hypothetical protein [Moraxella canis]